MSIQTTNMFEVYSIRKLQGTGEQYPRSWFMCFKIKVTQIAINTGFDNFYLCGTGGKICINRDKRK